jgi:glycosyltransferase involved in cell wall biosynthesis
MNRIAFFGVKTFPSRGGTDRVAENIINTLKDKYRITVYCLNDPIAVTYMPGVKVIPFRRWLPGGAGVFLYFFLSALHLFILGNVDLVHIHKTESTFFAPLLRVRYKIVSTSHEAQYKSDKWNRFARIFFYLVERMFVYSSHICTCISQPLTDYYATRYRRNVRFIANGINPVNESMIDSSEARAYIPTGADLDRPFVLFAARRLMKIKGCHLMLEALHKVGYTGQVFITGELHTNGEYWDNLQKLSFGLNVHYLGFVNWLPALLGLVSKAELFIFPSETEGMSIMLLEVASVGTPIIASDIPENKQVFHADEVMYFRSMDSEDLAMKLDFALANPVSSKEFGIRARERVNADYVWSKIATQYAHVYNELLA